MTQMAYHFGALLVLHSFQIYLSRDRMAYKYDFEEYEGEKLLYMRRVDFEVIHEATKHLLSQVNRWNINAVTESNPQPYLCLLYTSPSPRDRTRSRMPSSA